MTAARGGRDTKLHLDGFGSAQFHLRLAHVAMYRDFTTALSS